MKVLTAAARRVESGSPVWNLAAGQPSTPAPEPVRQAAHRALDEQILGYTEAAGIRPLRQAIATHYGNRYQLDVDPDRVCVTTGASGAFLLAFLATFDPGDRVGVVRPGYPAYRNILRAVGCEPVDIASGPDAGYQPTPDQLEGKKLNGLVLASPANPTGATLAPDEVAGLAVWCAENDVRLISDEIYHGISYTRETACAWATDRNSLVVNSFSKYFSMTGWRLGWLLVPDDLMPAVDGLAGNFTICPPAPAQYPAVYAFDAYDECDAHVRRYAENRRLLLDGLIDLGITTHAPADGAFYVYADVSHLTKDSLQFCWQLLERAGVATAPGVDFDPVDGHEFLRMSFAGSAHTITGALAALRAFLAERC